MSESVAGIRDRLRTRAKTDFKFKPNAGSLASLAKRRGRANLFQFGPALALDVWTEGGYPNGFLELAYQTLGVTDPSRVLHLFAGGGSAQG